MRNQTILVDINKETCKILKYKQYDNNNILQIIVEENYKKINLNEYVGFAFFELPSGLIIKKRCEIEDNVITIIIDNNVLSEEGKVLLDLTLSDGEDIFTLFRINLVIEETIDRDEAIIIEAGWDIVAEIAKFDKAEEQRVANEERRVDYESVRIANESDRQNEEMKRIANENVRVAKENERLINEQGRVNAEQGRVTRFNEMEAIVSGIDMDITVLQNDVDVLQNDMTNAQTQTFTVTDAYKFEVDHDGMTPSLVTLNNIEGQSEIVSNNKGSNYLRTTNIKSICIVDTSKNYLDDAIYEDNKTTHSIDGYNINVVGEPGWSYVIVHIQNLEIGNKYCFTLDVEVTSGNSALELVSGFQTDYTIEQCVNSRAPRKSANSAIGVYVGGEAIIRLHASLDTTAGNVTYKNLQINKVKEMIVPDIQLNSLPNGVKDKIKDGTLIKRTGYVNLGDLVWYGSAYNDTFPNAGYRIYYAYIDDLKLPASKVDENKMILCNMLECKSFNYTETLEHPEYNIPAISGHPEKSEIRIKLETNDATDLESLRTWLSTNNVSVVYELNSPEYIPVNLTIKADKGDTVVINTTKTMDLTYDIQLNTRAQIDALQKSVKHSDIIARDLNELIKNVGWDFVVHSITEGSSEYKIFYYILPGGLIIQGGRVMQQPGNYSVRVNYSIPFTTECIMTLAMGQWSNTNDHYWVAGNTDRKTFCEFVKNGNADKSDEVYWLAIGH